jgi:predicted membrane chloride channel (bestrophin family)
MLVSLALALKHRLRHEPFVHYDDLQDRLAHIPIMAHEAERRDKVSPTKWETVGLFLGFPMAEQNPRQLVKNPSKPLGNVPLEIHSSCSAYIQSIVDNGTLKMPGCQTQALVLLSQINDILNGTERILNTPLPLAYSIAIAQTTWVYILLLPFQLVDTLDWITIPATIFAAYIILGLALIGREIENPFGDDVNDLPLEGFCKRIEEDIDIIMSHSPKLTEAMIKSDENAILYPLSRHGYRALKSEAPDKIRALLRAKLLRTSHGKGSSEQS